MFFALEIEEPPNFKTFRWMLQMAGQKKAVIMGSYIVKESNNYFNRLYAVYPDETFRYYDKKHLFGQMFWNILVSLVVAYATPYWSNH